MASPGSRAAAVSQSINHRRAAPTCQCCAVQCCAVQGGEQVERAEHVQQVEQVPCNELSPHSLDPPTCESIPTIHMHLHRTSKPCSSSSFSDISPPDGAERVVLCCAVPPRRPSSLVSRASTSEWHPRHCRDGAAALPAVPGVPGVPPVPRPTQPPGQHTARAQVVRHSRREVAVQCMHCTLMLAGRLLLITYYLLLSTCGAGVCMTALLYPRILYMPRRWC